MAARRLLDAALPIVAALVFVAAVVAIAGAAGSTLGYDYQAFVQHVADARRMKYDEAEPLAHGRVWTGAQALERKLKIKRRDGGIENLLLLIADTRTNRSWVATIGPGLASDFPLRAREVLQALAEGLDPGGSGIVML